MNIRRRISGILSLLILVLGFQLQDCNAATPPAEYEVWDRMPAEAEVNAKLRATASISLYNAPRGTVVVGSVSTGEIVQRISCVAYTHPQKHPVKVLRPLKSYKKNNGSGAPAGPLLQPGSYVYLLMYTGEGTYLGWYNNEEAWWLEGYNIINFSKSSPRQPWGEYVGEATSSSLSIEAWYCLRKNDGTTGWTMVAKNGDFSYEKLKREWK